MLGREIFRESTISLFSFPLIIGMIGLMSFLIYANTLASGFVFDDQITIVENLAFDKSISLKLIWHKFNTRFITGLSFAMNYSLGQMNVVGYHLVNICIHIFNSFLIYLLVILTGKTPKMNHTLPQSEINLLAFFSALIFATHPIQTQAVTYITQRASSLAALFYLVSLVFYIKSRLESKIIYHTIALVMTILGMFTKENTFTIPFMIIIYELTFWGGWKKGGWRRLKEFIPFLMTLMIIPLILASDPLDSIYRLRKDISLAHFSMNNLYTELNVLRTYIRLLFLPIHQNLDYDYPQAKGFFELPTIGSFIFLVGILIISFLKVRYTRLISFCIWWFFITISVEFCASTSIGRDIIFEHYLYLPMVGFAILVPYILFRWFKKDHDKAIIVLSLLVAILSVMTYQRNRVWENGITLWSDVVKKSPNKARPYNNLGFYYSLRGEYDRAIDLYRKAMMLDSEYTDPYYNLGYTYLVKRNYPASIRYFEHFIELDPTRAEAYNNLGLAYAYQGDFDRAIALFQIAFQLNPANQRARYNLTVAVQKKGKASFHPTN